MKRLLKNAEVYQNGGFTQKDIAVDGGRIVSFDGGVFDAESDLTDCIIVPGFADVHVHLREPGFFYKESVFSGTRAAARGGYTVVCSMPNLSPPPDTTEHLFKETEIIAKDALIDVKPYGCITVGRLGKNLSYMEALAPFVVAFSDDGNGVEDDGVMREAMLKAKSLGRIVASHCEVSSLSGDGYINQCQYARINGHKGISSESEYKMVERDLRLAKETGVKLHICHVSTKESVDLIRSAKSDGVDVTCETAPHYLVLDDTRLEEKGSFKMYPPLRGTEDRLALTEALADKTIDMIATDHAPHSAEEKSRGLKLSPPGIVGLETAFPVLFTFLVKTGKLSLERLIDAMCVSPRRRFALGGGSLEEGEAADLTVVALSESFVIDSRDFLSKGRSTPFEGEKVFGKILLTLKNGRTVWKEDMTKN